MFIWLHQDVVRPIITSEYPCITFSFLEELVLLNSKATLQQYELS
jgi:hypothetical protein